MPADRVPTCLEEFGNTSGASIPQAIVTRLADMTPKGEDLRFYHPPEVVESKTADGTAFDGIVIQSGNRADPLDDRFSPAQNSLFYLRDFNVTLGVYNPDFKKGLLALLDKYIEDSMPMDLQTWQQRPVNARFIENPARLAGPFL